MKKRHKKSGNKSNTTQNILLVTAILGLIKTFLEFIKEIID